MNIAVSFVLLAAYCSLIIELIFLHVPSVASSRRILLARHEIDEHTGEIFRFVHGLGRTASLALFMIPLLFIYALFAYPIFVLWVGPDPLNDYAYDPGHNAQYAGMSMLILGRMITLASVLTIRARQRSCKTSPQLTTTGLFRWSRNPGLLGMYAFVIGIWLAMPSLLMAFGIIIYVGHMHYKVLMEEEFLTDRIGATYIDYCNNTRRYL